MAKVPKTMVAFTAKELDALGSAIGAFYDRLAGYRPESLGYTAPTLAALARATSKLEEARNQLEDEEG